MAEIDKLKTLKDIEFTKGDNPKKRKKVEFAIKLNLKKEAIKWVKHLEERGKKKYGKDFKPMKFFKYFFNITEEDLLIEDMKNTKVPKFKQKLKDLK